MLSPSRAETAQFAAGGGWVPVSTQLLADLETPLSAYWKLAHDEPNSFLLESVTGGEQVARYSMIGVRPRRILTSRGSSVFENGAQLLEGVEPLAEIWSQAPRLAPGFEGLTPKFCGGAVGTITYDYVRQIEKLPNLAVDDLNLPDIAMMLVETVVVFDHAMNQIQIISLADGSEESYDRAEAEIHRLLELLRGPLPPLPSESGAAPVFTCNRTPEDYQSAVADCIQLIRAGDAFQVVPSQRLSCDVSAHPITVYRALRSLNPSPYMFLMRFDDFDVVGASPELLVSLSDGVAGVRPIAGTRLRGSTVEQDEQLAKELLADEKERAEHVMLIDLGRNDLGRVCDFGSVKVRDLMTIERYSHVMHIVSSVTGQLRDGLTPADLVRATFPAGTLSGAPKIRAMEIIEEHEPTRRGLYGGAIGFLSSTGDLDLAIAIRSALMKDGKCFIQAGAGIVYDSDPAKEHEECRLKARAVMKAIEIAQAGL